MVAHPRLTIGTVVRRALIAHARRDAPKECCGFLLGRAGRVLFAAPMANVAADPVTQYRVDPRAHMELQRTLRGLTPLLDVIGVYHSHPRSEAEPSPTDVAQAFYPDWAHVIVSLSRTRPVLAAYRLANGRATRIPIALATHT